MVLPVLASDLSDFDALSALATIAAPEIHEQSLAV
jgi:hypothetical protein